MYGCAGAMQDAPSETGLASSRERARSLPPRRCCCSSVRVCVRVVVRGAWCVVRGAWCVVRCVLARAKAGARSCGAGVTSNSSWACCWSDFRASGGPLHAAGRHFCRSPGLVRCGVGQRNARWDRCALSALGYLDRRLEVWARPARCEEADTDTVRAGPL